MTEWFVQSKLVFGRQETIRRDPVLKVQFFLAIFLNFVVNFLLDSSVADHDGEGGGLASFHFKKEKRLVGLWKNGNHPPPSGGR